MKLFFAIFCFLASAVFTENLESHLDQHWEFLAKIEVQRGVARLYVPNGTSEDPSEFFAVFVDAKKSTEEIAPEKIEEVVKTCFESIFPGSHVQLTFLDRSDRSLVYEWDLIQEEDQIYLHGLGGVSRNLEGTITSFAYQTIEVSNLDKIRDFWLPMLREAVQEPSE